MWQGKEIRGWVEEASQTRKIIMRGGACVACWVQHLSWQTGTEQDSVAVIFSCLLLTKEGSICLSQTSAFHPFQFRTGTWSSSQSFLFLTL